jgi:hypothetical protein
LTQRLRRSIAFALVLLSVGTHPVSAIAPSADKPVSERVRPILARCARCHSGDAAAGALDLTRREKALEGGESGETVLKPGDSTASRLYRMVAAKKMPPKKPLTPDEIVLVREWIDSGAAWDRPIRKEEAPIAVDDQTRERWAFQPVTQPETPAVGTPSTAENAIDAFVLSRLEASSLTFAPPADRVTFIRRATFDLLGLPPIPEEIDAFVSDASPRAVEALIDRLLASPHYGERWARHWLDVARFAESHGFEYDRIRDHAWRYRDYVIRSLNDDKPYAQFVTEQIAGDVAEPVTSDGVVATGFLVAGPWDEAGALQQSVVMKARAREEELEDVVSAVGQTFLGVTINCARCHDHKFDPIPQRDYYRIKAAFEGVRHGNRSILPPGELQARAAKRAELLAESAKLEASIATIERDARAAVSKRANRSADSGNPTPIARWTFEVDERDEVGSLVGNLRGAAIVRGGRLVLNGKGAFLESEPFAREIREKTLEAWVYIADLKQRGGGVISLERRDGSAFDAIVFGEREAAKWLVGSEFYRRTRDLAGPVESKVCDAAIHVAIAYAADGRITMYRDGAVYGAPYVPDGEQPAPLLFPAGDTHLLLGLRHTAAGNGFLAAEIEEARVYDRALSAAEITASFRAGFEHISDEVWERALRTEQRRELEILRTTLAGRRKEVEALESPLCYAANPSEPPATFVLARGDIAKQGESVSAGGLSAVENLSADWGLSAEAPEGERRRKLAEWITNPANPLAARVMVNRVWHYHFGTGLVATPNDFGANGDRPSHQELLDWLVKDFLASGGSLKALHRRIMRSNAYRQSSRFAPKAAAIDSEDRLLWRYPPRRLEGEAIRDAMLYASGELNSELGGPSFRPFTVTIFNSSFYTLIDPGTPEFNRRTVYRINVNSAKSPLLDALDCPDPSVKTPKRSLTTTPLQALGLMNNSFVLRQAQRLAARTAAETSSGLASQVNRAYRLTLGRGPTPQESASSVSLAREHGVEAVAWVLFNSSEFLYSR